MFVVCMYTMCVWSNIIVYHAICSVFVHDIASHTLIVESTLDILIIKKNDLDLEYYAERSVGRSFVS